MSNNPLLEALRSAYGDLPPEDDPNTVRGLLGYCRGWLNHEVGARALNNPCLEMAGRLQGAADSTYSDLSNNPDLSDEAREPIIVTAEGFQAIADILRALPLLAIENRRDEFQEALDEYEAQRLDVLDATDEIQAQMSGRERRCTLCGLAGKGERCEDCDLLQLYPDPKQLSDYSHKSAHLSPSHRLVYRAYLSVLEGEQSLETLLDELPALSTQLGETLKLCQGAEKSGGVSQQMLVRLRNDIEAGLGGIARMYGVAKSYRTSDLNRGWEDIFESAVSLRRDLNNLAGALGHAVDHLAPTDRLDFGAG